MSMIQDYHVKDQLFDAVPWIGVGLKSWKILRANKPAANLFGYDQQDIIGVPIDDLVCAEDTVKHVKGKTAFVTVPVCYDPEQEILTRAKRKDGTEVRVGLLPRGTKELFDQGLAIVVLRRLE